MDVTEAVLVKKSDPDRKQAIKAYKAAILKLMKAGEWLYIEKGTAKSGSKSVV
jgi:hypothetical protein